MARRRESFTVTVAGFVLGWFLVVPWGTAQALHVPSYQYSGTFPNVGIFWIDDTVNGGVSWFTSDACRTEEDTMIANASSQLKGASEGNSGQYRGWWTTGIDFYHWWPGSTCKTTTIDDLTDVHLDYMTDSEWNAAGHTNVGGSVKHSLGSSSWCGLWGATKPCGWHISTIDIHTSHYNGYTTTYRVNFLLHEGGHTMAFKDYCNNDGKHVSITRNGTSTCSFSGGYKAQDRTLIRDYIYKNSPVFSH